MKKFPEMARKLELVIYNENNIKIQLAFGFAGGFCFFRCTGKE